MATAKIQRSAEQKGGVSKDVATGAVKYNYKRRKFLGTLLPWRPITYYSRGPDYADTHLYRSRN